MRDFIGLGYSELTKDFCTCKGQQPRYSCTLHCNRLIPTKIFVKTVIIPTHFQLKKFLRGRIEDLRLGTKIWENLCRFCLLRKDFVSKFDQVSTLNYYCYLCYFGLGKLYDWGQITVILSGSIVFFSKGKS
ncbi:hypothetical protein PHYBLDRAFT_165427 [Phycomyces blakesleeanus NRRL 1555(-)]|uniref:Uncharacterized protein n=1 Tax=Phycomyces blakesleeanus (strain ATCC 8743b / DSM 1359 / FGSC 10004 / NBRC 33097 / NRRL 1555) TaxID=763407 RepID=A0A167NZ95_PHYB8|nr:hypothetical protein PHYBLDRAFT_165427 [Phycomyces blakesleeanus NRRL 1555(-)]OAD76934.1 hypothetical protein PHYBLDRAFT_165427 [Phycomyces blakesleeanus NRRL 1555(-)]|eukprot:XP_018294974.1 hypothetical protein PHYBLDRAFT_165427 [Phycomyces blakesleeanus NRRL 1555(-)]